MTPADAIPHGGDHTAAAAAGSGLEGTAITNSEEAEQEIVAVGAVSHVIKRAFHQFYKDAHLLETAATAGVDTARSSREGQEALDTPPVASGAAGSAAAPTPRHAPESASPQTNTPRREEGEDIRNRELREQPPAETQQPERNPYVALGEAKKAEIQRERQQKHENAVDLLRFLETRHREAKEVDDAIAQQLSDKGLVLKAQIPMGPSNLRLDANEIIAGFGGFLGDNLLHATQLVREYQQRREEKSGNGPMSLVAQKKKQNAAAAGVTSEPLTYLNATDASSIRTETTLTMHQGHIASVKTHHADHVSSSSSSKAAAPLASSSRNVEDTTDPSESSSSSFGTSGVAKHSSKEQHRGEVAVMDAVEKRKNMEILHRMQNKLDFLRNPRYVAGDAIASHTASHNNKQRRVDGEEGGDDDDSDTEKESSSCFVVVPTRVEFTAYDIGGIYEQVVYLRNTSHLSRRLRVLPPGTLYFSIHEVLFPDPSGLIAPGMHVQIKLRFTPDSRADYKDCMKVQYEGHGSAGAAAAEFTIPLAAHRKPPQLSIPLVLRAQNTLVGMYSMTQLPCKNTGGRGRFWLMTEEDWGRQEASSMFRDQSGMDVLPTRQEPHVKLGGAFTLSPSEIELDTGESVVFQLQYVPSCIGEQREKFVMVCDNCLVQVFQVVGRGCQVEMSITSINGKQIDASITHMGVVDHVGFDNLQIHARAQQSVVVSNDTPIDLAFTWKIEPATGAAAEAGGRDDALPSAAAPTPPYQIHPPSGVIVRNVAMEFAVAFLPTQARVYPWKATLYINEIPACSVPGPHQRMQLVNTFQHLTHDLSSMVLEAVECLAVRLDGAGVLGSFSIAPSYWNFCCIGGGTAAGDGFASESFASSRNEVPLQKNVAYTTRITLHNQSNDAPVAFEVDLANVQQRHLAVSKAQRQDDSSSSSRSFDLSVTPTHGELAASCGQACVEVSFTPRCVGAFSLAVPWRIPTIHAATASPSGGSFVRWLLLEGVVASGQVEILSPEVDFGLVLVGGSTEATLSIRNRSHAAAADWRFVHLEAASESADNSIAQLPSASSQHQQVAPAALPVSTARRKELRRSSSRDSIASRRSISSSSSGNDTGRSSSLLFTARDILPRATIAFVPDAGSLAPGETKSVKIMCFAGAFPERLRASLCCQVTPERIFSGETLAAKAIVSARAEIQSPNVFLSPSKLHLGTTYLGVPVRRTLELINVSNLEATFKFLEPQGVSKAYTVDFSPKQGTIRSKETVPVMLVYTPRQAGKTTVLLACSVRGLAAPLGIEISTNQKGLVLSYELLQGPQTTPCQLPRSPKEIALERGMSIADCDLEPETNPLSHIPKLLFGDAIPLGQRRTLHLLVRNFSGIEARIDLDAKKFAARPIKASGTPHSSHSSSSGSALSSPNASSSVSSKSGNQTRLSPASKISSKAKTGSSTTSTARTKTSSSSQTARKKLLLADTHEQPNRFQSEKGKEYVRQCSEDMEDQEILSQGHGVAFQVKPTHLRIPPWEQLVATVICFNNMPGVYSDDIVSRAVGVPPVFLHAQATVVGTPLTLDRNCVGLYYRNPQQQARQKHREQEQPTFHFGQLCTRSPAITRTIRVINRGPKQARLKWKLVENGRENQLVTVTLRIDFGSKVQMRITPCAEDDVEFPFVVTPEQAMVPPFATIPFQITYTPPETLESPRVLLLADAFWYDLEQMATKEPVCPELSELLHAEEDPTHDLRCESSSASPPQHHNSKSHLTTAAGKAFAAVRAANSLSRRLPAGMTDAPPSSVSAKCLRILLAADVIEPELFLDKSKDSLRSGDTRSSMTLGAVSDGTRRVSVSGGGAPIAFPNPYHIKFTTWSTIAGNASETTHLFHRTELFLVNHLNTRLTFRLESSGPFSVYRADSIAPKHPLSSADLPPAHRRAQGETFMFMLPPQMSVRIDLRFDPSQLSMASLLAADGAAAPRVISNASSSSSSLLRSQQETQQKRLKVQVEGQLLVKFTNRSVQTVKLIAAILRPLLVVSPSVYFFGRVHLSKARSVVLRLANPTVVPAAFTIQHIPAPIPVSKAQKQEFKLHHAQYVDEPSVFMFSMLKGVVTGPTMSLKSAGGALPGTDSTRDLGANHLVFDPVAVTVTFQAPAMKKRYKSRFRFVVAHGLDFEVVLEGEGHLDEHEIEDQDRSIVRTSALEHSHRIFTKILR